MAHPVVDHVVQGLVERGDGVAAVVAETVEPAGEGFVGHGDVARAGEETDLKEKGLAGRAFRFGTAERRGEDHRLRLARGVAQGDAEAAVVEQRQRRKGQFVGIGHHAEGDVARAHKRRGQRALEGQREVGAVGEPLSLPDEGLPTFGEFGGGKRGGAGVAHGEPSGAFGREGEGEDGLGVAGRQGERGGEGEVGVLGEGEAERVAVAGDGRGADLRGRCGRKHVGGALPRVAVENPVVEAVAALFVGTFHGLERGAA